MKNLNDSFFWSVIVKKMNTRLQSWFALVAWVLTGGKLFWQLTQMVDLPMSVQQGTQVVAVGVRQMPPAHLAALPTLLGVWAGGFVTIVGLAAYKSNRDKSQTNKLIRDGVAPATTVNP